MFPPEDIAAAKRREMERNRELARWLAGKLAAAARTENEVLRVDAVPTENATLGIELLDGTLLTVEVAPAD